MEEETDNNHKAVITFAALLIMAVIVTAAVVASPRKQASAPASTSAPVAAPAGSGTSATTGTTATFKDGSYTATGSYESPGGNEHITVHVALKGGVVTATSATSGAGDPEAHEYQSMFISGYTGQVVGKRITDIHLSRVSGSSLTSQGFNDALSQIENQAGA